MNPFLDTNILVYSIGIDHRMLRAKQLVLERPVISVQVMNEFVNVAKRKLTLPWPEIEASLQDFTDMVSLIVPLTMNTHRLGVQIARDHQFRIYDSMIIASASIAGCGILYTEDLADGAVIAGVQIRNPFKPIPSSAL